MGRRSRRNRSEHVKKVMIVLLIQFSDFRTLIPHFALQQALVGVMGQGSQSCQDRKDFLHLFQFRHWRKGSHFHATHGTQPRRVQDQRRYFFVRAVKCTLSPPSEPDKAGCPAAFTASTAITLKPAKLAADSSKWVILLHRTNSYERNNVILAVCY
jgi:hypothetical protein